MKLFNKEKGKEVVYVQLQDIMYLMNDTDLSVPASIFVKTFGIVNDKNRFNFLKFDKEDEVEFFKKLDFIIDYSKYRDLTDEGLEQAVKKFRTKANNIVDKWNSMTCEERENNSNLLFEHQNLEYVIMFIQEVYNVKHGVRVMEFPF